MAHKKIEERKSKALPIVYKELYFSVKEPEINGRIVTGYLAVFNNRDSDGDVLIKGCFAKSLAERGVGSTSGNKIAHLWQHDMKDPLGNYSVLKEDDFGLYFECEYDDIPQANRALTQFKSGTLNKFSIGYCYVWDKMEYDENFVVQGSDARGAFICKEINLFEGSVVTLAANDMTYFAGLKSEQRESILEDLTEEVDQLLRGIKGSKQYELRQLTTKLLALAHTKPVADQKQTLKSGQDAKTKGGKLSALSKLSEVK